MDTHAHDLRVHDDDRKTSVVMTNLVVFKKIIVRSTKKIVLTSAALFNKKVICKHTRIGVRNPLNIKGVCLYSNILIRNGLLFLNIWINDTFEHIKFIFQVVKTNEMRRGNALLKCTLYCHTDNHIINTWSCSSKIAPSTLHVQKRIF